MIILAPIFKLLITITNIYTFFLTVWIITRLLIHFGIVNSHSNLVRAVMNFLGRFIEPVLQPIRNIVPMFGNIDLSPLVLYLLVEFLRNMFIYGIIAVS